jgi:hypothetical protein
VRTWHIRRFPESIAVRVHDAHDIAHGLAVLPADENAAIAVRRDVVGFEDAPANRGDSDLIRRERR